MIWCHRHATSVIKFSCSQPIALWASAASYGQGEKFSAVYNPGETRDKRPLGRDPDRSWRHRHSSVKLPWSQYMDPLSERQHTRMLPPMFMKPCATTKKLYTSGAVTPPRLRSLPDERLSRVSSLLWARLELFTLPSYYGLRSSVFRSCGSMEKDGRMFCNVL